MLHGNVVWSMDGHGSDIHGTDMHGTDDYYYFFGMDTCGDNMDKGNSPKRLVRTGATRLQRRPHNSDSYYDGLGTGYDYENVQGKSPLQMLIWDLQCSMAAHRDDGVSMQAMQGCVQAKRLPSSPLASAGA